METHVRREAGGGRRYDRQRVLIVGLGLSGVSALNYLAREGADLVVTDSRAAPNGIDALRAQYPQIEFCLGAFSAPQPLSQFTMAVVSPGVSLDEPFVKELAAAGAEIVGDVELFARVAKAPVIGITGSNGKSTVTTLVGEMAKAAGLRVAVGGNLGTPALDLLADDVQLYVLELSSFQLETTKSLRCAVATILNLSQDHLDRHGTMEQYMRVKARILRGCAIAVLNTADPWVIQAMHWALAQAPDLKPARFTEFSLRDEPGFYGYREQNGRACLLIPYGGGEITVDAGILKIRGRHNIENALAALALADNAGIPRTASIRALADFPGLPHRCEFVASIDGVDYFNDSKGTNVGSTLAALKGLPTPIVWLGGGQGKGQSFVELREALAAKGRAAVLYGEDAAAIEGDVLGALPVWREADMGSALRRARQLAQAGDCVLLSPACASFDQFKSYVDRGDQFRAAVRAMA